MSNHQLPIKKKVGFCLQEQECDYFGSQPEIVSEKKWGKRRSVKLTKKYSITTASSNVEEDEQERLKQSRFSIDQLDMTSIELLERKNNCKITQPSTVFPSSFSLIRIPPKQQNVTLKQLSELSFSVLSYSINEMIQFSTEIIYSNLYTQKIFSKSKLRDLVFIIANHYRKVPYHNFSHAFSLMLLNFQCLEMMPQFKNKFSDQELFCTFLAGIAHDINHNGTNNMFEVKRKTELAIMYNNQSVLQNMHVSTLWKILKDNPQLNFLEKSSDPNKAKQIITRLILGTDMSVHFKKLETLQKRRKQHSLNFQKFDDKMFMMEQIFHACDLGNPTAQYESYISWASLLSHQFNEQAKLERLSGIEVTKSFQYQNLSTLYNDQVWFVGKIVLPLWNQISLHLPELSVLRRRIEENSQRLNEKLAQQELKVRI